MNLRISKFIGFRQVLLLMMLLFGIINVFLLLLLHSKNPKFTLMVLLFFIDLELFWLGKYFYANLCNMFLQTLKNVLSPYGLGSADGGSYFDPREERMIMR